MTASDASPGTSGAGAAAGQVVLVSLAVCEAIALEAIAEPARQSGAVLQARRLRARAGEALAESTRAYLRARAELELSAAGGATDRVAGRDATLRRSLVDAADSLIALAEAAADASVLAAGLVAAVEPSRRPDAAGATELALGAARGLRHLVEANLVVTHGDQRRRRVLDLIAVAEQAAAAARGSLEPD